jgi:hypothetical protein
MQRHCALRDEQTGLEEYPDSANCCYLEILRNEVFDFSRSWARHPHRFKICSGVITNSIEKMVWSFSLQNM